MKSSDTYAALQGFVDLNIVVGTPGFSLSRVGGGPRGEFTAPDFLMSGRVAMGQGMIFALLADTKSTHYLMDGNGQLRGTIPQGGRGMCALYVNNGQVEVHAQGASADGGATCTITVYGQEADAEGVLKPLEGRAYSAAYGSEGILQVTGPASIRSSAGSQKNFPNDIILWNAVTAEGWWCGQINRVPHGGSLDKGTIGLVSPTGEVFIAALIPGWDGYTNQPSYLAVKDGVPRVAMQDPDPGNSTPDPDELTWLKLDSEGNLPPEGTGGGPTTPPPGTENPPPGTGKPPVETVTTYVVTLERGEQALIKYVERREFRPMLEKVEIEEK